MLVPSRKGAGKLRNHIRNGASRTWYLAASNTEPVRTHSSMNAVTWVPGPHSLVTRRHKVPSPTLRLHPTHSHSFCLPGHLTMIKDVYSSSVSSQVAIEFCLCSSGCDPASFFPLLPRQSAYRPRPDLVLSFLPTCRTQTPLADPFGPAGLPCWTLAVTLSETVHPRHCVRGFSQPTHTADARVPGPHSLATGRRKAPSPTLRSRPTRSRSFCLPGHLTTIKDQNLSPYIT